MTADDDLDPDPSGVVGANGSRDAVTEDASEDEHVVSGERVQDSLVKPPPSSGRHAPHLRRVWLKNFKGYEDFEVRLGRFNVLAGANNAGKSTLLQGIDLLYSL